MIFAFDDFELNSEQPELRRAGRLVRADALVLRLLSYLLQNAGKLVSKDELVQSVWDGRSVAGNAVTVSMARLRKLLGQGQDGLEYVTTTYGRGYRFVRDVAVRAAPQPEPAADGGAHDATPPFVGREPVLLQLRRALGEARAGRGRSCVLLGEPGIGKTRAVETFVRELGGAGARVAWGFCREAADTPPLWPWLRLLSEVLAADVGARAPSLAGLPEDLRVFLGLSRHDAASVDAAAASARAGLASPLRHRHFDTILQLFEGAAVATPWVLVIDDLHRADVASLELLVQLLDQIAHTRILLIATLRHLPGWRSQRLGTHLPQVLGHRNCERITLDRLEQPEVLEYVAMLRGDPDGALGRAVYARSEGNPFFMAEFARTRCDRCRGEPQRLAVPAAALELVRQRVACFDADVREVLSVAAVLGRSFELPTLAAVTEREPSRLMVALDEAIEAEVVVATPGSTTAFAFGHALLREVLYDALPAPEQRSWHRRVARVLEVRHVAGDSVPASELAYHAQAALPDGDVRTAIQHCRAAAAAAATVFASADVVRYARQALEALDLLERPSVRLRTSLHYLIAIFARSHAADESARAIQETARLAGESGDVAMLLRTALLFNLNPGLEPMPGQTALLERVLTLLQPQQRACRSIALATLALAPPYAYSAARSGELIERALPLCPESASPLARYALLVCKLYRFGGPAHSAETADELERMHTQNPSQLALLPFTLASHRAVTAFQRGELATLTAACERASLRAHAVRSAHDIWQAKRFTLMTRVQFDPASDGCNELELLHAQLEPGTIWGAALLCAFDRAVVLSEFGRVRPLTTELYAALEYRASDPPGIWALKLRALAATGQLDAARAALRAVAVSELGQLPCDRDYLGTLGHLARAALLLREGDYAEAIAGLLAPYPDHFAVGAALWCEGAATRNAGGGGRSRARRRCTPRAGPSQQ